MRNWVSGQLTRPLLNLKLKKYWLPEEEVTEVEEEEENKPRPFGFGLN